MITHHLHPGPPLSPTSPLTDTIANTFVLGPNHPALQTPVTIENQLPLSPESVAVAIDRLADPESDFASDLASALGGINQLPGDYSSYQSSPALPVESNNSSNSTPMHRFHPHPGSPANSVETAAPSPVAEAFSQAIQLEESIAYPTEDHGLLTGLHSSVETAINLTHQKSKAST